ncbi:hypothetical protein QM012_000339 [Aureobasidium pullulans]|uniref:Uncharacterized protein n=1 Tax=Aureobasidium pullulans TaxID=5580 RepID=A0ABR0TWX4_AURPU
MFSFAAIITLIMGATTFLNDNFHAALKFTSWTQRLLAAPPKAHFQESVTVMIPISFTTTVTSAAQAFTSTMAPPGDELTIYQNTLPSASFSFFAALKKIICALYALLRLPTDAATLVSAFFFASLLLALIFCFFNTSPPAMKPEDLIYLEAQVITKDELIQQLRTSYAANTADLLRRLQVQKDEADKRLSAASAQHRSALATKDQQICALRHDLAFADLREEQARFNASDEVIKLHLETGHLHLELVRLRRRLDAQEELVARADEAQEKAKVAEERALGAAQEALEANQKVETAEKAHKEYLVGERARAQAAIDEVKAKVEKAKNDLRVEEYKVQGRDQELKALKKEMKELTARVAEGAAAHVQTPTILQCVSSASRAQEMRDRIQAAVPVASGALPTPDLAPAAVAPSVAAPGPSAPAGQPKVRPSHGSRSTVGFAPIRWGVNSKRKA